MVHDKTARDVGMSGDFYPSIIEMVESWFWAKVDKPDGPDDCWLWTGGKDSRGYGHLKMCGRTVQAHRLAWELIYGSRIPLDMSVLHDCPSGDNPACVRHLWLGTQEQNVKDRDLKSRQASGEKNGRAKLTAAQAAEIRRLHDEDGLGSHRLASRYGLARTTIRSIIARKTWR